MNRNRKFLRRIVYVLTFLTAFLILRCEEEKPVGRDYPRLTGTMVTDISDGGATFSADLYSMGTEVSVEYGFLWGMGGGLRYETSDKIILGKPETEGVFTADIRTALAENREYKVTPFVKTDKRIVYGPSATFISLGSQAPEILGFTPHDARWYDTVEISGRYFSWVKNQNAITLNQVACEVIFSSDSKLRIIVNPNVNTVKNVISVSIMGNKRVYTKDTLKLQPSVIKNFTPASGTWNQIITIDGRFNTFPGRNAVYFGNKSAQIISVSLSRMVVKAPYLLSDSVSVLKIVSDPFTVMSVDSFRLLPPTEVKDGKNL